MFRILLIAAFLIGAFISGKWKNFSEYYPTILYFIICSLIYDILFRNYPLWRFELLPPLHNILSSHSLISLAVTFTAFPATALMYLGYYPKNSRGFLYILLWAFIYIIIEVIGCSQNAITYHNGWNLGWSFLFNILAFSLLRVHYKKPLLAWAVSPVFIILISVLFRLPVDSIK